MRIVAGKHRGRRLVAPEGLAVRPTGDRTREALFNILGRGRDGALPLTGLRVLDAFAGTGALGLEALSRGAKSVAFMESQASALKALESNVAALDETDRCQVLRIDVLRPPQADHAADLVLMDPPYNQGLGEPSLAALRRSGWIVAGTTVVIELMAKEPFEAPAGYEPQDERKYGKARLVFLEAERD